ncbi:hypothetical protein [Ferribacterium limneticum]|uniref:hypothetical protein n=1 Tax=Ferribacterium limneticum TaxID=76259 RepID=UPI001CFA3FA6|nr:hypothetical protein [Ferribacterium limneticum]UCV27059.1 hypothetical protein KI617_12220 [Ferribacterium limneticum]UCV30976.1 hypothetical protein KI608_12220 [Ferribacterium limneticum]
MSNPIFKGLTATCLVVTLSLAFCLAIPPEWLMGWGTLIPVAMVPAQIVISLFWGCGYPRQCAQLSQPWKGIAYLLATLLAGSLVAWVAWQTIGGGISPPLPFVNMYLIFSVAATLWLVVVFQGWPFNRLCSNSGLAGVLLWLWAYLLAYGLFRSLFDFSFLKEAPVYVAALDPGGVFMAWLPLIFSITSVMVLLTFVLFDFWPIQTLAGRFPIFGRQPYFAIFSGIFIVTITSGIWNFFVGTLGMDLVRFLVKVSVSGVFGIFVVLVMLDGLPSINYRQPWRGILLSGIATVLAIAGFNLYEFLALSYFALPAGQPGYVLELWIASAMLAITFPAMVGFAKYFDGWPLFRNEKVLQPAESDMADSSAYRAPVEER